MGISFDNAQINIQGIQSIVVSTIQPSPVSGDNQYLRLIQIYTDPPSLETRRPVLTIACYGGSQTAGDNTELQIQVPANEF